MHRSRIPDLDLVESSSDAPEGRQREQGHELTFEDLFGARVREAIRRAWPWIDRLTEAELDRLDRELDFVGDDLARGRTKPLSRHRKPRQSRTPTPL